MEIKRETSFTKNVKCQDVYTESHVDYILPDYQGDVRKILFTEATLRPSGRFAGGDEVEFSGVVVYNVVYLDGEENLSSCEFTSDYDYSVKCDGECYKDSLCETSISNYTLRLIGPRKISARANLVGSARLCESDTISVLGDAFDSDEVPELCKKSVKIAQSLVSAVSEREYAESMAEFDGMTKDEVKVIYTKADTELQTVEPEDGAVRLCGRIHICAVVDLDGDGARTVERSIEFDEKVEFEGVSHDMKLTPTLTVSSLKCMVNANDNGCELVGSAILEMCVLGESNETVDLTLDGYLKDCPTDNSYGDFSFQTLSDVVSATCPHSAEVKLCDIEMENLQEVLFLNATPKVDSVECHNGCVKIGGEVRYCGVGCEGEGDEKTYVGLKFTAPFSINVNICCQNDENLQVETKLVACMAQASVEDKSLNASCNLGCIVRVCSMGQEKILLSSVRKKDEKYEKTDAKITVYYPTEEDTLFSVAKRFHTSGRKIAKDNEIYEQVFAADNESGSLAGIKKILIY